MRTWRAILLCALLAALVAACATRQYHDPPVSWIAGDPPPLAFADFPYTSVEGEPWPVARLPLPRVAELHGMAKVPEVAYVELNPSGEPDLIFIHGLGSYLKFWRYQLDAFAAMGYHVLAVDLPGYGKSDKPASFPYTMEAMADAVRELGQALEVERPILVGHSMGGQTALSYAIRFPDEVSRIVLASPAGFEEFTERERQWYARAMTVGFIKGASEYDVWGSVRRGNFNRWKDEYAWLIEERVRVVETPDFTSYAYANVKSVQGLSDNDFVRQNLDKVKVPSLIVYGDRDRLIPNPFFHGGFTSTIMERAHAQIPHSRLQELDGCGHTVQMDCAPEFNAAIKLFFEERFRDGEVTPAELARRARERRTPSQEPTTADAASDESTTADAAGAGTRQSEERGHGATEQL